MNMTNTPIPVSLMGQTFSANAERMWHLNEIHKGLDLPDSKSPSEWRNAVSVELRTSGNLRSLDGSGTFADELGTIAYAMWVSTDFYLMVAGAFVAMRNSAISELRSAKTLLDANMPKASTLDIKHKHASHFIIIEGQAFKANDSGMWDLTDIWRTLKLPKGKQPGKWVDIKKAKTLEQTGNIGSLNKGRAGSVTQATKRATLAYAGWVSDEFEAMVYDAFEAILEMPEVALLVADKMRSMGNAHSAAILERHTFSDKCDWSAIKRPHKNTQEGLRAAVARGTITKAWAIELGLKTR